MFKKTLLIFSLIASLFASVANAEESVNYLLTAASKGDLEIVSAILESGGNPNTKDEDGDFVSEDFLVDANQFNKYRALEQCHILRFNRQFVNDFVS